MHDPSPPFRSFLSCSLRPHPSYVRSYQATTCITDFSSIIRTLLVTSADGRQGRVSLNMMASHHCTNRQRASFIWNAEISLAFHNRQILIYIIEFVLCFPCLPYLLFASSLCVFSYAFHGAGLCHWSEQQHSHADHAPRLEARCGDFPLGISRVAGKAQSRNTSRKTGTLT